MDKLPEEILLMIFQHVQSPSQQRSFVSCLLCCHLWYRIGLPLLCNEIKLGNFNLERFLVYFPSKNLAMTKLLTISVEGSVKDDLNRGYALKPRLCRVFSILPKMINLSTLSFIYNDFWVGHPRPIFMERSAVVLLIENLPKTCVNLEIDTHGLDELGYGTPHLCDTLRRILPRLQHLRLRLRDLCPGIFATGFDQDSSTAQHSVITPVKAPFLKTVVINCCSRELVAAACGTERRMNSHIPLMQRLYEFAACGCFPAIERLWLVYKPRVQDGGRRYSYFKRCDIAQNRAWFVPFINDRCYTQERENRYLMRTPEEQEVLAFECVVEKLVEGQTWKTAATGRRVPSAHGTGLDIRFTMEMYFSPLARYRADNEVCSCEFHRLWHNEKVTGMQLMSSVQKEGLLDESPMRPICPKGWQWYGGYLVSADNSSADNF